MRHKTAAAEARPLFQSYHIDEQHQGYVPINRGSPLYLISRLSALSTAEAISLSVHGLLGSPKDGSFLTELLLEKNYEVFASFALSSFIPLESITLSRSS